MLVSQYFRLNKSQAQLDFVDVDTDRDTLLFIDPYAIEIRDDIFSEELKHYVSTYFQSLLDSVRSGDADVSRKLVSHLSEPQETFLGLSKGVPSGRGIGLGQGQKIISALRRSRAFNTGTLTDLGETELFIEGVSSDKLSDLTTNVIRTPLIRYTQRQCELNGMEMRDGVAIAPAWDPDKLRWSGSYDRLPIVSGKPVILIPKVLVRRILTLDSQEFYNKYMIDFLKKEEIRAHGSLVRVLKNKSVRVDSKKLKQRHPYRKPELEAFAQAHPGVLNSYKRIKGATGPLNLATFQSEWSEIAFAKALIEQLRGIPVGTKSATSYHDFVTGALIFLLYPDLADARKEDEIHEGRKRIDLTFVSYANGGFFYRMRTLAPVSAGYVFIECKNYRNDVANPELDQLSGRFSSRRGRLGFLLSRAFDDKDLFIRRCRDTAADDRGFILPLDDDDLVFMLTLVAEMKREQVSAYLDSRYRQIVS